MIFVFPPRWGPTDVQMRIRCSGEHHHGSRVPHYGRKTPPHLASKGPKNHPVRTDGIAGLAWCRTGPCSFFGWRVQHVDQARRGVRCLGFLARRSLNQTMPIGSMAISATQQRSGSPGIQNPIVRARAKHSHVSLAVHLRYCRVTGHRRGTGHIARRVLSFLLSSVIRFPISGCMRS